MDLPVAVSAISQDAVEASKALAILASKVDGMPQRLRDDYEELMSFNAELAAAGTSTPTAGQSVGHKHFIGLERQVHGQFQQEITIDRNAYERWHFIGNAQGLVTDTQIATFLMQHYENSLTGVSNPSHCLTCQSSFYLYCPKCSTLQLQQQNQPSMPSAQSSISVSQSFASTDRQSASTIQPSASNIQPSASAIQPSSSTIQLSASSVQSSTSAIQSSASNVQMPSTMQPSISAIQPSAANVQPSASTIQLSASTMHPSISDIQVPTSDILSSTLAVQPVSTIQSSVPVASSDSVMPILSWTNTTLPTDSTTPEGTKNILLSLPQFVCESISSGSLQATGLLDMQNGSLAIMANVLTSPSQVQTDNTGAVSQASQRNDAQAEGSDKNKTNVARSKPKSSRSEKLQRKKHGTQNDQSGGLAAVTRQKNCQQPQGAGKLIECSECRVSFSSVDRLKTHHRKKHSSVQMSFTCGQCNQKFSNSRDLSTHTYRHTGEMPYKCTFCPSAFTLACNLKTHLRTHTGERPFQCTVCSKAFTEAGTLKVHVRKHTGERPFKCDKCEMAFPNSGNLARHMLTHTGVKPYQCQHCTATFTQPGSLKTHIRTHTGERPYKCENCGAAFTDNSTLWKHRRNHSCDNLLQTKKLKTMPPSPTVSITPAVSTVPLTVPVPPISLASLTAPAASQVSLAMPTSTIALSCLGSLSSDITLKPGALQTSSVSVVTNDGQQTQQLSYKPETLSETTLVNTIGWCFPLQQN